MCSMIQENWQGDFSYRRSYLKQKKMKVINVKIFTFSLLYTTSEKKIKLELLPNDTSVWIYSQYVFIIALLKFHK